MNPFLFGSLLWTALWWFIAWSHLSILGEYSFFPLWIGYIVTVNAASEQFFKNSLIGKMKWSFLWLFVVSIPMWWMFEYLNTFVQNWHYIFAQPISPLHFNIQASVDFSTVIPAVLSTTFLFRQWLAQRKHNWARHTFSVSSTRLVALFVCGVIFLWLLLFFPSQTFPLLWIAPLLILEPINYAAGFPSILGYIERGEWLVPVSAMAAALFCGFWWEMWNFFSLPKWFYTLPYAGFWKIFEMPLLGYIGYLPFGLITVSFVFFIISVLTKSKFCNIDARTILLNSDSASFSSVSEKV